MKSINIEDSLVRRNRIPILIYSTDWIQLFSNHRTRSMQRIIGKLENLLAKEKDLEGELSQIEKKKKVLMSKILHLSNELNENKNNSVIEVLDKTKRQIDDINVRIPQILEELENIPFEIDKYNTILLKDTIKRAYEMINQYKQESETTQNEINKIRESLSILIQKKVDLEEDVSKIYSYLHGIMGATEMEKLDKDFLNVEKNG
ncbi:MAG: hypothetical protein M0P77_06485 [Firmicutes bacterium]|nr:hypothetical protein [Bacillota bacterium]